MYLSKHTSRQSTSTACLLALLATVTRSSSITRQKLELRSFAVDRAGDGMRGIR